MPVQMPAVALRARSRRSIVGAIAASTLLAAFVSFGTMVRSGAAVDTNAPVLASLAISPATVDTAAAPATVTITARLTDERSPSIGGTAALSRIVLTGPGGQQQAIAYISQAQRVSGTAADGTYRSTLQIPRHSASGRWAASAVLVDISGNTRTLTSSALVGAGFPAGVTQTGAGDTTPPQLVAIGLAPASVDTSQQAGEITVTVHANDDLSGVSDGVATAASQVVLRGPSGAHHAHATLSVDHRTAGNALDATFVVAVTLPRWSEQGQWTIESVTLVDQVGNHQSLSVPGVTFMQTGIGDTSAPQFRAFSLSATSVDVRAASATVVVRGRIVDDISGAADGIVDSASSVVFESPSGRQRLTVPFGASQRIAGDSIDGNYSMSATVAAHAEPGSWTMTDAWPTDAAGNVGHLGPADWNAKGFAPSFTVVSDTPVDTGPVVPTDPLTTPDSTTGSVFTTTSTSFDPQSTTTTMVGDTTTIDPSSTTLPDDSTTASSSVPDDSTSTSTPTDTTTDGGGTTTVRTGPTTTPTTTTVAEHPDSKRAHPCAARVGILVRHRVGPGGRIRRRRDDERDGIRPRVRPGRRHRDHRVGQRLLARDGAGRRARIRRRPRLWIDAGSRAHEADRRYRGDARRRPLQLRRRPFRLDGRDPAEPTRRRYDLVSDGSGVLDGRARRRHLQLRRHAFLRLDRRGPPEPTHCRYVGVPGRPGLLVRGR